MSLWKQRSKSNGGEEENNLRNQRLLLTRGDRNDGNDKTNIDVMTVCMLYVCYGNFGHTVFVNQNSIGFTSLSWLFERLLKDGTSLCEILRKGIMLLLKIIYWVF